MPAATADPVQEFAEDLKAREEEALRRQETTAKRLATLERKEAERAAAEAERAIREAKAAKDSEPTVYKTYDKLLKAALRSKGDDAPMAWRKVEQQQRICLNTSARARSLSSS